MPTAHHRRPAVTARRASGAVQVAPWLIGVFERASITFDKPSYRGLAFPLFDDTTDAIWLQAGHRCGDIRISASRPAMTGRASLQECTDAELVALAGQDAWYGCCRTVARAPGPELQVRTAVADWHDNATSGALS